MTQPSLFDGQPRYQPPAPKPTIDEQFVEFDRCNPFVMDALAKLSRDYVERGHTRVGIGHLFEIVRWSYAMHTTDPHSDLKLNNNLRSRYSRELMRRYPDLDGLFETRELRAA